MKLLSKQEVDLAKAKDRRLEIDEGKKLAVKVDKLRQLAQDEQAKFLMWRDEQIAAVKAEILVWVEKLDALKHDVQWYEDRRAKALVPVDERKEELRLQAEENEKERIRLEGLERSIRDMDAVLDTKEAKLLVLETNLKTEETNLFSLKKSISNEKTAAFEAINEASAKALATESRNNAISQELIVREGKVAEREKNAMLKEHSFAQAEAGLSKRERVIIDREERAAREIRRVLENK